MCSLTCKFHSHFIRKRPTWVKWTPSRFHILTTGKVQCNKNQIWLISWVSFHLYYQVILQLSKGWVLLWWEGKVNKISHSNKSLNPCHITTINNSSIRIVPEEVFKTNIIMDLHQSVRIIQFPLQVLKKIVTMNCLRKLINLARDTLKSLKKLWTS